MFYFDCYVFLMHMKKILVFLIAVIKSFFKHTYLKIDLKTNINKSSEGTQVWEKKNTPKKPPKKHE